MKCCIYRRLEMYLICTKETDGFTVGKKYKVLGCVAEYVQLRGDDGEEVIMNEVYFDVCK